METVTEESIKNFEFFRCPQSLPGVAPLAKKPEDSGYGIARLTEGIQSTRASTVSGDMKSVTGNDNGREIARTGSNKTNFGSIYLKNLLGDLC